MNQLEGSGELDSFIYGTLNMSGAVCPRLSLVVSEDPLCEELQNFRGQSGQPFRGQAIKVKSDFS